MCGYTSLFNVLGKWLVVAWLGIATVDSGWAVTPAEPATREELQEELNFEKRIRPLLVEHCIQCHGQEKQEGGLRLDSRQAMLRGGDSGPAIIVGNATESLLISAIHHDGLEMPPSGKLTDEKIASLDEWITRGARWPNSAGLIKPHTTEFSDEDRSYWAFQPLTKPAVPDVSAAPQAHRVHTDVDRFILSKLTKQRLSFAPEATRPVLARRLFFDLLGMPPTPEEMQQYLQDDSELAYERLVDRLLDDQRYGQRWARHWLDLVRYAESDGFKQDAYRPTAYLYRDYVIDSFNEDKPYDLFVQEQLAGDELPGASKESLAATGFLRHWIYEYNQRDVRTQWSNILNDLTDVTGDVFLGMSVGCARCHDHKFDPLLQKDYFRLQACFAPFLPNDTVPYGSEEQIIENRERMARWEQATQEIRRQMNELEEPARQKVATTAIEKFPHDIRPLLRRLSDDRSPLEKQLADLAFRQVTNEWNNLDYAKTLKGESKQDWLRLRDELQKFDQLKPASLPTLLVAGDVGSESPEVRIPQSKVVTEAIEPAALEILGGARLVANPPTSGKSTGRRTALAMWINSPGNPLPHRVITNRIWQYHFGTGIVSNSSDFGRLGQSPTHPELLDWLTSWFLENGRSFKKLHRLLVTSAVYRQSSQHPASSVYAKTDEYNRLLWRYPARRLDAEQIRDAMLVVSGQLDIRSGGPAEPHTSYRRTVYTKVTRNTPNPLLATLDAPDGTSSVSKRSTTTTAVQALLLANSPWPIELANKMADLIVRTNDSPEDRVVSAYWRCFQRAPDDLELERDLNFLKLQEAAVANSGSSKSDGSIASLADLCHVLMNTSEFLYVD